MLVASPGRTRLVVSIAAAAVFVWSALVITVVAGAFSGLSVASIATEGVVLSAVRDRAGVREPRGDDAAVDRIRDAGVGWRSGRARVLADPTRAHRAHRLDVRGGDLHVDAARHDRSALQPQRRRASRRRLGGAAALEVSSDATRPVPVRRRRAAPGCHARDRDECDRRAAPTAVGVDRPRSRSSDSTTRSWVTARAGRRRQRQRALPAGGARSHQGDRRRRPARRRADAASRALGAGR